MTAGKDQGGLRWGRGRGILYAAVALALAWSFGAFERRPRPQEAPTAPAPPAVALPTDTALSAGDTAAARLLILQNPAAGAFPAEVMAAVRQGAAAGLVIREGDADQARTLGIAVLPAYILYDGAGRERHRRSGPGAASALLEDLRGLAPSAAEASVPVATP